MRISRNKGMTLVEILMALALLGVVIVPLGKFFIDSFKFQNRNQRYVQANKVAEFVIETFKNGQMLEYVYSLDSSITLKEFQTELGILQSGLRAFARYGYGYGYGAYGINDFHDYNIRIESKLVSDMELETEDMVEIPENFEEYIEVSNEGINCDGDFGIVQNGNEIVINSGYKNNNLKITNNTSSIIEFSIRNLSGSKINIYKDSNVILKVLEGTVSQFNLSNTDNSNVRYSIYKVKVTVTDTRDSSIVVTLESTIRC